VAFPTGWLNSGQLSQGTLSLIMLMLKPFTYTDDKHSELPKEEIRERDDGVRELS